MLERFVSVFLTVFARFCRFHWGHLFITFAKSPLAVFESCQLGARIIGQGMVMANLHPKFASVELCMV